MLPRYRSQSPHLDVGSLFAPVTNKLYIRHGSQRRRGRLYSIALNRGAKHVMGPRAMCASEQTEPVPVHSFISWVTCAQLDGNAPGMPLAPTWSGWGNKRKGCAPNSPDCAAIWTDCDTIQPQP